MFDRPPDIEHAMSLIRAAAVGKVIEFRNGDHWVAQDCRRWSVENVLIQSNHLRVRPEPIILPWRPEEAVGRIIQERNRPETRHVITIQPGPKTLRRMVSECEEIIRAGNVEVLGPCGVEQQEAS